jgi:soluble lytic murein transglycosylase-like protein
MTLDRSVLLAGAMALLASVAPATATEFTFKRVKPPPPGATKRIDIQITAPRVLPPRPPEIAAPESPAPEPAPVPPASSPRDPEGHQAWFWDHVSPVIGRVHGRFPLAAARAAEAPRGSGVAAPSAGRLQAIAKLHGPEILGRSVGTRVSPALVLALISVESSGRPGAVSPAGAEGLMQLIPATATRFGVRDAFDPAQNIAGGVAYLDWLMREFDGDPILALAGYNAGEGAVRRHRGVPPFAETRTYVPRVLAAWNVARLLCRTPPVLPGDGCVFDAARAGG